MTTLASAVLTTRECMSGVFVAIQCHSLFIDFTMLPMHELDGIFEMDLMFRHQALIDCRKKVHLRLR